MSKQAQIEQFVEGLSFGQLTWVALQIATRSGSFNWLDDEWPDKEDELRVNVIDRLIEIDCKETPHA